MPTEVTIHPTARIAFVAVLFTVVVGGGLVALKRLLKPSQIAGDSTASAAVIRSNIGSFSEFLLPVIRIPVSPDAHESDWSEALAIVLNGRTEVATKHGRVDVLTDHFAIEVDRLDKWHESIGQASHYAETTKKRAAIAIILLPDDCEDKIELIESTCNRLGIKLLILQTTKAQAQERSAVE
jgi:hypothetical protein